MFVLCHIQIAKAGFGFSCLFVCVFVISSMHFSYNTLGKQNWGKISKVSWTEFVSLIKICVLLMYVPKHTYLLTPENCGCKASLFPFLKPKSCRCCVWWGSMCSSVGIMVCWSCVDSACLQNQHFNLSWHSKDAQDATDSLVFPISIAAALWNTTQDRAVVLTEAAQTNP